MYLYADEVNLETHSLTPQGTPEPGLTASTTAIQGRSRLYHSHSRSVSVPARTSSFDVPTQYTMRSFNNFEEAPPSLTEATETSAYLNKDSAETQGELQASSSVSHSEVTSGVGTSTSMIQDIDTGMSALNYSVDITDSRSPMVHTATLSDTTSDHTLIPKSPRTECIPTFLTQEIPIAVNNPRFRIYRQASTLHVPASAKTVKPINPFITIERLDGSLSVSLRSGASAIDEYEYGNNWKPTKEQELAGPYREAAIWEFIGQTYARAERYKKLKPKKKRIVRTSLERITPPSTLSKSVLAYGDDGDNMPQDTEVGVRETFTGDILSLGWNTHENIPPSLALPSSLFAYFEENDRIRREASARRSGARGARRFNRHSLEWDTPLSDPELAYGRNEEKQQETRPNGERSRSTNRRGRLA